MQLTSFSIDMQDNKVKRIIAYIYLLQSNKSKYPFANNENHFLYSTNLIQCTKIK